MGSCNFPLFNCQGAAHPRFAHDEPGSADAPDRGVEGVTYLAGTASLQKSKRFHRLKQSGGEKSSLEEPH